jgi:hypothetical protein
MTAWPAVGCLRASALGPDGDGSGCQGVDARMQSAGADP